MNKQDINNLIDKARFWTYKEIALVRAGLILTVFFGLAPFLGEADIEPMYPLYIEIPSALFFIFYTLICIRYIRGKEIISKKSPYHSKELTIWSYLWRFVIVVLFWIFSVVAVVVMEVDWKVNFQWIAGVIFMLVFTFMGVWLLFCSERIKFAKRLYLYFKGYNVKVFK